MYPALQPTLLTTETFHLERNRMSIGTNRIIYTLGVLVFPLLFINAIFYSLFEMRGVSLALATGTTALVLLNLTIYLLNKKEKGNRTLIIGFNDLKVLQDSTTLYVIPFEQLVITKLNWGIGDNIRPAIRIGGQDFPCMTIGCRTPQHILSLNQSPKMEETIDCTTYLISDEAKWQYFLLALHNLMKD